MVLQLIEGGVCVMPGPTDIKWKDDCAPFISRPIHGINPLTVSFGTKAGPVL